MDTPHWIDAFKRILYVAVVPAWLATAAIAQEASETVPPEAQPALIAPANSPWRPATAEPSGPAPSAPANTAPKTVVNRENDEPIEFLPAPRKAPAAAEPGIRPSADEPSGFIRGPRNSAPARSPDPGYPQKSPNADRPSQGRTGHSGSPYQRAPTHGSARAAYGSRTPSSAWTPRRQPAPSQFDNSGMYRATPARSDYAAGQQDRSRIPSHNQPGSGSSNYRARTYPAPSPAQVRGGYAPPYQPGQAASPTPVPWKRPPAQASSVRPEQAPDATGAPHRQSPAYAATEPGNRAAQANPVTNRPRARTSQSLTQPQSAMWADAQGPRFDQSAGRSVGQWWWQRGQRGTSPSPSERSGASGAYNVPRPYASGSATGNAYGRSTGEYDSGR